MKNLIIDATKEEVFFSVITETQSYNTSYINSRENFDQFIELLLIFFKKYKIELKDIEKIFVNQGPGKLSSIRTSISIAKDKKDKKDKKNKKEKKDKKDKKRQKKQKAKKLKS